MKKFLSLVMACAMVLALGIPALAANGTAIISDYTNTSTDQPTVQFDAAANEPTIKVTFDTGEKAIKLNPYKLPIKVGDNDVKDQVISALHYARSASDVPLKVDISAWVENGTSSNLVVKDEPIAEEAGVSTKDVFLFLKCERSDYNEDRTNLDGMVPRTDFKIESIIDSNGKSRWGTVLAEASTFSFTDDNTYVILLQPGKDADNAHQNVLYFQVGGNMRGVLQSGTNGTAANPYKASEDTLKVNVVFNFEPLYNGDNLTSFAG